MRTKRVSMQSIADTLGVSKVTVFKALNNQPGISRSLSKKIHETADSLGYLDKYTQNNVAAASFAFVTPKRFFVEHEMFYTSIYLQVNKRCVNDNRQLGLFVIEPCEEAKCVLPEALNRGVYSGIFVGGEMSEAYLESLTNLDIPIVVIDHFTSKIHCDMVLVDNYSSGFMLTQYLINRGHCKIGFVGQINGTHNIADRYFGYRKALLFANLPYMDSWIVVNQNPDNQIYHLNFAIPDELPTAFVCHCDNAAYFMMQKLTLAGYTVPDDVSLVAFDNTDLAQNIRPALTTVENSRIAFANRGYETMLKRMTRPDASPYRITLHTPIIERDSVRSL